MGGGGGGAGKVSVEKVSRSGTRGLHTEERKGEEEGKGCGGAGGGQGVHRGAAGVGRQSRQGTSARTAFYRLPQGGGVRGEFLQVSNGVTPAPHVRGRRCQMLATRQPDD